MKSFKETLDQLPTWGDDNELGPAYTANNIKTDVAKRKKIISHIDELIEEQTNRLNSIVIDKVKIRYDIEILIEALKVLKEKLEIYVRYDLSTIKEWNLTNGDIKIDEETFDVYEEEEEDDNRQIHVIDHEDRTVESYNVDENGDVIDEVEYPKEK